MCGFPSKLVDIPALDKVQARWTESGFPHGVRSRFYIAHLPLTLPVRVEMGVMSER